MVLPTMESYWSESGLKNLRHIGPGFRSYLASFCRYPLCSVVVGDPGFNAENLATLEKHFQQRKWGKPYILFESKQNRVRWDKWGYKVLDYNLCQLWKQIEAPPLDEKYVFEVVGFEQRHGQDLYLKVACKVFGLNEMFLRRFALLCKKMSTHNPLIVIRDLKSKPIAIVGIICVNGKGFIHSLAVLPGYQGKGLSKQLLKICQSVGKNYGVDHFTCTSQNPRVLAQMDKVKSIHFMMKK